MASRVRQKPREVWFSPGSKGARPPRVAGDPVPRALRKAVLERDDYRCQRCGRSVRTQVLHYSLQHRLPGRMGGRRNRHSAAILVTVCGSATSRGGCHDWIENQERAVATAQGWLLPEGADPATCAVLRWSATDHPSWELPTEHGWVPAAAPNVVDTWSAASKAHHDATGEWLTAQQVAAMTEVA
jgi:hypothetical protein